MSKIEDRSGILEKVTKAEEQKSPALEAVKLVYGQRNLDYGDPFQNFEEIAEIANAIKDRNDTNTYEPYGVATVLCALKLARIKHNPSPDSFADLCGYTDIKGRMAKAELHKPQVTGLAEALRAAVLPERHIKE